MELLHSMRNFVVYIDNNDIVVKVPRETAPGEYDLASMSLIRPEYIGETVEYYSKYGNQPMQVNRIAKPKTFELKLEIKDGFIPNDPPIHDKPELKIPENPKPKEEKPKIPEILNHKKKNLVFLKNLKKSLKFWKNQRRKRKNFGRTKN